jgi:hypothetical protein
MKNSIVFVLLVFFFQHTYAQDTILTNDKQKLEVQILEKSDHLVKYKLNDFSDGPVFDMKAGQIRKIVYRNGTVDLMGYENPRKSKPIGISFGKTFMVTADDGVMYTVTTDYFILPQVDLELNLGSNTYDSYYYSVGSRFHLNSTNSRKTITPFIGLLAGSFTGITFVQVPIGLSYISKFGLQASFSINQLQYSYTNWMSIFAEFRVGWRFNK